MADPKYTSLQHHIQAVKKGERVFENAFQAVSRMILDKEINKVTVNGKSTFDFTIFPSRKMVKKAHHRHVR